MYLHEKGRCPFCMDFGRKIETAFTCNKCEIVFDEFIVSAVEYPEYRDKYWN